MKKEGTSHNLHPLPVYYLDFFTVSLTVVFGLLLAYLAVTNLPVTALRQR